MPDTRILIAAGGTGGHVYPAIAIADAIKRKVDDARILFVGTRNHMEWQAVPKAGYEIKSIWISGFHRKLTLRNLLFPVKLVSSLLQAISILSSFKPQVIVSCGGYVAGPVGYIGGKRNIPIVIQEQNSYPGVTNKLLARFASVIFTAFKKAADYFPKDKVQLVGNPTRSQLTKVDKKQGLSAFGFEETDPVMLVLGGSLGARSINRAILLNLEQLHNDFKLQIIWQCGKRYVDELKQEIDEPSYPKLRLQAYLDNMPEAYAAADLVVSRAGASSCSELMLTGKPSVLVPSPIVAGDHQTHNAGEMADEGAAVLLKDGLASEQLPGILNELIFDTEKLAEMSRKALQLAKPDAADVIADEILKLSRQQLN
jgi:UDP-N-acetylglucosamine--N-acetylmuramyl-(pentapeptide) pyrophosphoryl-undecaprenol N-acetylglucosamine transferase